MEWFCFEPGKQPREPIAIATFGARPRVSGAVQNFEHGRALGRWHAIEAFFPAFLLALDALAVAEIRAESGSVGLKVGRFFRPLHHGLVRFRRVAGGVRVRFAEAMANVVRCVWAWLAGRLVAIGAAAHFFTSTPSIAAKCSIPARTPSLKPASKSCRVC